MGHFYPLSVAQSLAETGHAEVRSSGKQFRAVHYDAEAAARPDWIWLPNTLVDGAADETPPVELVRQTHNLLTLRLLVNVYGSQAMHEDGGIHFRRIQKQYIRHHVGEQGTLVVWGFTPSTVTAWFEAPFIAVHLRGASDDEDARKEAGVEFWACWERLERLGLVQFIAHLVTENSSDGEVLYPVALPGTGLEIEQQLGQAAMSAAMALVTGGQSEFADRHKNVVMLAPVERHIEGVQMVGVARLRYRPRTARTLAFVAREDEWVEALAKLQRIEAATLAPHATSRGNQDALKRAST